MQSSRLLLRCSNSLFGSAVTGTLLLPPRLRFPPLSATIANSTPSSIRLPNCRPLRSSAARTFPLIPFFLSSQSSLPSILLVFLKKREKACNLSAPFVSGRAASDSPLVAEMDQDPRIAKISSAIRVIPNFPKPGIMFQDITTLLLDTKAFKDTIDLFVERYRDQNISVVAGIEARGFIFGPPIALAIGAKFVPMRKPNKLPGEVISEEYALEYGTDKMEMHVGAVERGERALVIDDLIATGGTLCAAIKLLERVGVHVVECACVIELPELKGRERLGDKPLFVLVKGA